VSHKILLVDDDEITGDALAQVLAAAGYQVAYASSFEEAREYLKADTPDLLITDLRLGDFNGLQLLVRCLSEYPNMPRILLTGFPDPVLAEEARRYGAVYLMKPILPDTLTQEVESLLRRTSQP
jgi:two-component system response regulator HydG